jgi:hypothetical protein
VTQTPPSTPAGWYPDPYDARLQRYWDGTTWTEHTAPLIAAPGGPAYMMLPPEFVVQQEAVLTPWARIAFVISTLSGISFSIGGAAFGGPTFGSSFGSTSVNGRYVAFALVVGLLSLASTVVLAIWLMRAGVASRRLGLPAKFGAGISAWSLIIPIIQWWFPYLGVRDLFPVGDPHREVAKRWWTFQIGTVVLGYAFTISRSGSGDTSLSAIFAGLAAMSAILAATYGFPLIQAALDTHTRIAQGAQQ